MKVVFVATFVAAFVEKSMVAPIQSGVFAHDKLHFADVSRSGKWLNSCHEADKGGDKDFDKGWLSIRK